MHSKDIINIIKARRESLQVTQETLAMLSGVGLRTLKQFESGKGNPTLLTLQKVGDALGLEVTIIVKSIGMTSTTTTTATTATPS
jgi:transcriptional regulator with XRE-family HTH domain